MESEGSEKATVTQVSFGGFERHVKAKDLVSYLVDEIGGVYRCRLKPSWTPPESYPNFELIDIEDVEITENYNRVEPHAFVHFVLPDTAASAVDAAGRCQLFFNNEPLKASLGPENTYFLNKRTRTTTPFKLSDVRVEIGALVSLDEFYVVWRGPPYGVDFIVDPFDGTRKLCFTRDTAFAFKGTKKHAVIECDFMVDFIFVRQLL